MSDKHRERAKVIYDLLGRGSTRDEEVIARALESSAREGFEEGMKRAVEVARKAGENHVNFAELGMPIEPSMIIAKDRARVANNIADAISS